MDENLSVSTKYKHSIASQKILSKSNKHDIYKSAINYAILVK